MGTKKDGLTAADLKWFEPERYGEVQLKALDAFGWSNVLLARIKIQELLENGKPEKAASRFNQMRADPIAWAIKFHKLSGGSKFAYQSKRSAVRLIRIDEVFEFTNSLKMIDSEHLYRIYSSKNRWDLRQCWVAIAINLAEPRTTIDEDFSRWLSQVKVELSSGQQSLDQPTLRRFTKAVFGRWIKFRCLPYLDLQLFASIRKTKISKELILEVLKLDEVGDKEAQNVFKTTANICKTFNRDTFNLLRNQDAREAPIMNEVGPSPYRSTSRHRAESPAIPARKSKLVGGQKRPSES